MSLKKAYTFLFVPFSFTQEWEEFMPVNSIWGDAELTVESDILYPYIQDFLQATANLENRQRFCRQKDQNYIIYSIKENSSNSSLADKLNIWNKFIETKSVLQKNKISFKILNRKKDLFSPKLIVCPFAKIGLLLFPVEIEKEDYSIENLMDFNYAFHKTDKLACECQIQHKIQKTFCRIETAAPQKDQETLIESVNKHLKEINEINNLLCIPAINMEAVVANYTQFSNEIQKKQNELNESIQQLLKEKEVHPSTKIEDKINQKQDEIENIDRILSLSPLERTNRILDFLGMQNITNDKNFLNLEYSTWNVKLLVQSLLKDFSDKITRFNSKRLHLFTYYQMGIDDESSASVLDDFIRITRCENRKYLISDKNDENSEQCYMQTFKNIYIGSSVEGGAIMTLLPNINNEHIQDFDTNTLPKRYLWIYIMVLIQRHTLLHLIHELTLVDDNDENLSLINLRKQVEYLSKVKVNTYFSDVSDYTQHNQFYRFCAKNLGIKQHFNEIDEKMDALNAVIIKKVDEKKERRHYELEFMIAILTILSASNDGTDLFEKMGIISKDSCLFKAIAILLFTISFIYFIYRHWISKKNK